MTEMHECVFRCADGECKRKPECSHVAARRMLRASIDAMAITEEANDAELERLNAEITRLRSALEAAERERDAFRGSLATASGKMMLTESRFSQAADLVEQAFRDGIAYATNVKVDSVDLAWEQSKVKAQLADIRGGLK